MHHAAAADRGHCGHAHDAKEVGPARSVPDGDRIAEPFVQRGQGQCTHDYLIRSCEIVAVQQWGLDPGTGDRADYRDVLAVDYEIDKVDARVSREVTIVGQQRG
jgi:hypothetical protein